MLSGSAVMQRVELGALGRGAGGGEPHDVALGEDAEGAFPVDDDDRPDAPLAHEGGGGGDGLVRQCRHHRGAHDFRHGANGVRNSHALRIGPHPPRPRAGLETLRPRPWSGACGAVGNGSSRRDLPLMAASSGGHIAPVAFLLMDVCAALAPLGTAVRPGTPGARSTSGPRSRWRPWRRGSPLPPRARHPTRPRRRHRRPPPAGTDGVARRPLTGAPLPPAARHPRRPARTVAAPM